MGLFSYKYELQMVAAEKQMPAIRPILHPVIQPLDVILVMINANPMVVIRIVIKEPIKMLANPFLAFGSFIFAPVALIHAFLNKAEYQIAPKKK